MPRSVQSRLYRFCDRFTEALIYFVIIFGPWAFGTTQDWSIWVMNSVGFALGLLWLAKLTLRQSHLSMNVPGAPASRRPVGNRKPELAGETPALPRTAPLPKPRGSMREFVRRILTPSLSPTVGEGRAEGAGRLLSERHFTTLLGAGTICILLWCLISAWNARAIYQPEQWHFEYRKIIPWLPHSYDQAASWFAFWQYLGLAGFFWALRDWLLGGADCGPWTVDSGRQDRGPRSVVSGQWSVVSSHSPVVSWSGSPVVSSSHSPAVSGLPIRLRRLFWILALNGGALAIESLMQRAEGGGELLWLVQPHINKTADAQFGPYAYRANAAQYFNLLWPAVLGFWWACVSSLRRLRSSVRSGRRNRLAVLLPCVLIMAVCPLVAASRGGAIVAVGGLIMAVGILTVAQWRRHWAAKVWILLGMAAVVGGGALLGWQTLAPRMEMLHEGYEQREALYLAGRYMAHDNAWFGTGPGTFSTLFQLYYRLPEEWVAQMHNDWLETMITFGRIGAVPIFLMLLLVLVHWFSGTGIHGNKYFVLLLWVSLGGCLMHAFFDFPFQIHSILTLFLVLCAVLSCLTKEQPA